MFLNETHLLLFYPEGLSVLRKVCIHFLDDVLRIIKRAGRFDYEYVVMYVRGIMSSRGNREEGCTE